MNKKIIIFSIIATSILLLSIFPTITSKIVKNDQLQETTKATISKKQINETNKIEMNVLKYNDEKKVEKTRIILTQEQKERLGKELKNIAESNISTLEKFEKELEKIKDYGLVEKNTKLEDIINVNKFEDKKIQFENVTNKNFIAHYAPILIVGGGFGLGLGMKREKSLLNSFSHFLIGVGGLAYVLCVDFLDGVIYNLISFLMPILVGYIAGFTGLIIFSVEPGLFYSNLVMIGTAPFTVWLVIPEEETED